MKTLMATSDLARKTVVIMPPRGLLKFSRKIDRLWNVARAALATDGVTLPPYERKGGLLLPQYGGRFESLPLNYFDPAYVQQVSEDVHRVGKAHEFLAAPAVVNLQRWEVHRRPAVEFIKQTLYVLLIAMGIRSFAYEPFNIARRVSSSFP